MIFIKKPNFDCAMLVANLLTKLMALSVLNIISVESQFETSAQISTLKRRIYVYNLWLRTSRASPYW